MSVQAGGVQVIVMLILEEIIKVHEEIIRRYGGEFGLLNIGNLEFMVDQVNNEDRDILWKAALILKCITNTELILKCIVCGHPFLDGNKRTALEVMETYLTMYEYEIIAETEDKISFVLTVATEDMEMETIVGWLKKHVRKRNISEP